MTEYTGQGSIRPYLSGILKSIRDIFREERNTEQDDLRATREYLEMHSLGARIYRQPAHLIAHARFPH